MHEFVVGIDVGDVKKGFHVALLQLNDLRIDRLEHYLEPEGVSQCIKAMAGECVVIGIDAPARGTIRGPQTRSAERALVKLGYRPQWTRRHHEPPGWMKNGERLWRQLAAAFPQTRIIETFPTAASNGLDQSKVTLSLRALQGQDRRVWYKDYLDACICAVIAEQAHQGRSMILGADDELNPIHILESSP